MKGEQIYLKGLYRVQKKDLEKCADVATAALLNDPSSKYLLKHNLTYQKLYKYFLTIYRAMYKHSYIFAPSESIEGVLALTSPQNMSPSSVDYISAGILKLQFTIDIGILFRSIKYKSNCERIQQMISTNNAWYVFQFAITPKKQGLGLGSKLMKPFLNYLDKNQLPCYLETHKEKNVDLYTHYGFSLKSVDTLPDKKNKQYSMIRI
ncbi:hypothetical protein CLPUN_44070 [Clostridium puniceum]|uniref:N-acetyltransferase domain-containing protein n=1 Tax=Clostridium puniceum TaxID=29367 RepID=A0A1S8T7C9_9CLOT|nr:GNAT family N-acetyltransferase [Clostridium puniceum]OOM73653.1 hypothetical protein CLPUN_44070 [Clostridium puniceum]